MTSASLNIRESEKEPDLDRPVDALESGTLRVATMRQHFVYLLRHSILLMFAVAMVLIALFLTAFGPRLAPYAPDTAADLVNSAPSAKHLFGTDGSGFDIFSRVLAAYRIDVTIALLASFLGLVVGSLVGLLTSSFRGRIGEAFMRVSDTVQAFPLFVIAMIFVVMIGPSYLNIVIVIGLSEVPLYIRLIRGEVLSLRERPFVEMARANGNSELRIAFRHILPNAAAPALSQASVTFGYAILTTAGLSFLGAGIRPPAAEWGNMIAQGRDQIITGQWWVSIFPGCAMVLTVFSFACVADALQTVVLRKR